MPENTVIPWLDTRLTEKEFNFLKGSITTLKKQRRQREGKHGAGNVSRCDLVDKDNWFYENVLKDLTEKMFYRSCINYYEDYIEKKTPLPEFGIEHLWGNFQHQTDHVPLHNHGGLYSFVVFMKIPTHWKEQHALPICANSSAPSASNFEFRYTTMLGQINYYSYFLDKESEGKILFFPSKLMHIVHPFYNCDKERITISGNILFNTSNDKN